MGAIVDIQMARLQKLLDERKITLALEPTARDWLAEKGYDPAYGARPLKRVIQKTVQDPLAELILAGEVKDGETVNVSAGKQGLDVQRRSLRRRPDGSIGRRKRTTAARPSFMVRQPSRLRVAVPSAVRASGTPRAAGAPVHHACRAVAFLIEARQQPPFEHAAARQLDAHRIDEAAVDQIS